MKTKKKAPATTASKKNTTAATKRRVKDTISVAAAPASTSSSGSSAWAHIQYSAEVAAAKAAADRAAAPYEKPELLGGAMHHLTERLRLDPGTSKKIQVIEWLQRPNGVLRSSLMRGFIAGAVKKLGYTVASYRCGDDRSYRISGGGPRSTGSGVAGAAIR
jgi:hypothetical protein